MGPTLTCTFVIWTLLIVLTMRELRRRWRGATFWTLDAHGMNAIDIENHLDHTSYTYVIINNAHPAALAAVGMTRSHFKWQLAGNFAYRAPLAILSTRGGRVETPDFNVAAGGAVTVRIWDREFPVWGTRRGDVLHARLLPRLWG